MSRTDAIDQRRSGDLRGRRVAFAIRDIYIPTPEAVLHELHGDEQLAGDVVEISDSGEADGAYAIVEVPALKRPVVVPITRVRELH